MADAIAWVRSGPDGLYPMMLRTNEPLQCASCRAKLQQRARFLAHQAVREQAVAAAVAAKEAQRAHEARWWWDDEHHEITMPAVGTISTMATLTLIQVAEVAAIAATRPFSWVALVLGIAIPPVIEWIGLWAVIYFVTGGLDVRAPSQFLGWLLATPRRNRRKRLQIRDLREVD